MARKTGKRLGGETMLPADINLGIPARGPQGIQGPKGNTGDRGLQGIQGERGPQ